MKFTAWEARRHIEAKYKTALRNLGRFLVAQITADDTEDSIVGKLSGLASSDAIGVWARTLATTFITHLLDENSRTWRQAAAEAGQGRQIYNALQRELSGPVGRRVNELIDDNARYIKSLPDAVAQQMTRHMASEAFKGSRQAYKYPEFQDMVGDMANWHAKLIARTETAKAMSALTQARAEELGHDWYIWHTCEDQRVRDSHRHMDGVLCRFSDPPAPEEIVGERSAGRYNPGGIYNCRCYAEPIILWEEITWPAKVCVGDSIIRMSKAQFKRQFGGIAA
jgi:SPP1 gp7 family putative phage head morphogenesis protein